MIIYIIIALLLFGVLTMVHELGHFVTAKIFGVGINEFSIGMGPALYSRLGKDGVKYSLRALPIGGYVSMVGEDDEVAAELSDKALNKKPWWQRFIVLAAGSFMNLILGIVVMTVIVSGLESFPTNVVSDINVVSRETGEKFTEFCGIIPGDKIIKIGGERVYVSTDKVYEIMRCGAEPTDVTVVRNGKNVIIPNVNFPTYNEGGLVFGNAAFFVPEIVPKSFGTAVSQSFFRSIGTIRMIWSSLVDTISGRYGTEAISGPVGIVNEISETAKLGFSQLMYFFVLISMNVGIFNLLPLPALDGGRIVFVLVEAIRRKPIKPEYEGYVHLAGMAVLMCFVLFVTYNDIMRLIK